MGCKPGQESYSAPSSRRRLALEGQWGKVIKCKRAQAFITSPCPWKWTNNGKMFERKASATHYPAGEWRLICSVNSFSPFNKPFWCSWKTWASLKKLIGSPLCPQAYRRLTSTFFCQEMRPQRTISGVRSLKLKTFNTSFRTTNQAMADPLVWSITRFSALMNEGITKWWQLSLLVSHWDPQL